MGLDVQKFWKKNKNKKNSQISCCFEGEKSLDVGRGLTHSSRTPCQKVIQMPPPPVAEHIFAPYLAVF